MRGALLDAYQRVRGVLAGHGLGRFRVVQRAQDAVIRRLGRPVVDVAGHKMLLDAVDTLELQRYGVHEPFETEVMTALVRPGNTVVDLGANIGYYTLLLARLVGARGRVVAVEPDPDNFEVLRANVRLNGYRNVTMHQCAISDNAGTVRLYLSPDNKGDHRIYPSPEEERASVEVRAAPLDGLVDGPVDFIKMDIQGAEPAAVGGMTSVFGRSPQLKLLTEFWPYGLERFGIEPRDYLRALSDARFELWRVDEGDRTIARVDPEAFDVDGLAARTPPDKDYTNVLCVPPGFEPPDLA